MRRGPSFTRTEVFAGRWPLIGRAEELELIARTRQGGSHAVVVSGPAGVGKTRLAAEAVAAAEREGWTSVALPAAPGMAKLPMAALSGLVEPGSVADLAAGVGLAHAALRALAPDGRVILSIDDAHHLDDVSAGFLHQAVLRGEAFVIASVRTDEQRPSAITALWKDGLAERIELQMLSRRESDELVGALLEGDVELATMQRIWLQAEGNALFTRELVWAGVESGHLQEVEGAWRWRGGAPRTTRLREVIEERLGRLDADQRAGLEVVALAGSVEATVLAKLVDADVLAALEGLGLISATASGTRVDVSVAHPLYAEVVRDAMPSLRARAVHRELADAAEDAGIASGADRIRVALWRLAHGASVDPITLVAAADAARWSVAPILVEHLQHVLSRGSAPTEWAAAWRPGAGSTDVAVKLARAAWEANADIAAGATLVATLVWQGNVDEAAEVLDAIEGLELGGEERVHVALARAALLLWALGRADEARGVLTAAEQGARADAEVTPQVRDEVTRALAGLELNVGRPAAALEVARRVLDDPATELSAARASAPAAASLALLGRTGEAVDLIDRYLPVAMAAAGESALVMGELVMARGAAMLRGGRLDEADTLGRAAYDVSLASEIPEAVAAFDIGLARIALLRGLAGTALRHLREAASLLADHDPFGYRTWALAGIAHAAALLGREAHAREAMEAAHASRVGDRFFDGDVDLAEHRLLVLEGRPVEAAALARDAAARVEATAMAIDEVIIRHAAATLGRDRDERAAHAERLTLLETQTDSLFVPALAAHARASVERDGDALDRAADDLGRLGLVLTAAEAASAAATLHERAGRQRLAEAARRRAHEWMAMCEGARTPSLELLDAPRELTERELEIARLAARGLSSKAIADQLVVSIRTVDSHLYRAYAKLGVTRRSELERALASSGLRTEY